MWLQMIKTLIGEAVLIKEPIKYFEVPMLV